MQEELAEHCPGISAHDVYCWAMQLRLVLSAVEQEPPSTQRTLLADCQQLLASGGGSSGITGCYAAVRALDILLGSDS